MKWATENSPILVGLKLDDVDDLIFLMVESPPEPSPGSEFNTQRPIRIFDGVAHFLVTPKLTGQCRFGGTKRRFRIAEALAGACFLVVAENADLTGNRGLSTQ